MYLESISLTQFKNIKELQLSFHPKMNCLVGENGTGKTTVLDALYYLSFTKSYLNTIDSQNIQHDTEFFIIDGKYQRDGKEDQVYCAFKKGQGKVLKRKDKTYKKLQDHIGLFPLVIISPTDRDLILEGSDLRRKFMDGVISQSDAEYLNHLILYNRALSQRNALLKYFQANNTFDPDSIEVYNHQLELHADPIYQARQTFVDGLVKKVEQFYKLLSSGKEEVHISYQSALSQNNMQQVLNDSLQKDRMATYTTKGIHKDDLLFELNGYPIRKFGSQGQQKSFLIALKLAQFDILAEQTKMKPILLLDDVFDKLDEQRVAALVKLVNDQFFGQIFITDTHADRTEQLVKQMNPEYQLITMET